MSAASIISTKINSKFHSRHAQVKLKDAPTTIFLKSVSFYLQRIVLRHVQPHNSRTLKGVKIQSFISIADMSVKH